jgi:hypothetical protein
MSNMTPTTRLRPSKLDTGVLLASVDVELVSSASLLLELLLVGDGVLLLELVGCERVEERVDVVVGGGGGRVVLVRRVVVVRGASSSELPKAHCTWITPRLVSAKYSKRPCDMSMAPYGQPGHRSVTVAVAVLPP